MLVVHFCAVSFNVSLSWNVAGATEDSSKHASIFCPSQNNSIYQIFFIIFKKDITFSYKDIKKIKRHGIFVNLPCFYFTLEEMPLIGC